MSTKNLKDSQKQLIEKVGVFLEKQGLSPAAARISALLVISDELELTFEDIYQKLEISKSSASTAINFLVKVQRIEYITKPGDRKRYFRSNIAHWPQDFEEKLEYMTHVKVIFQEVLDQRTKETKEFNKTIAHFISFMDFMQSELPALIEKWKKKQAKQ
jgi:DNA-binding transcriptional regulator GbsR (MarR family)